MDPQYRDQMYTSEDASSMMEDGARGSSTPWEKFPEPQSWALNWDGVPLSEVQEWYNRPASNGRVDPNVGPFRVSA